MELKKSERYLKALIIYTILTNMGRIFLQINAISLPKYRNNKYLIELESGETPFFDPFYKFFKFQIGYPVNPLINFLQKIHFFFKVFSESICLAYLLSGWYLMIIHGLLWIECFANKKSISLFIN